MKLETEILGGEGPRGETLQEAQGLGDNKYLDDLGDWLLADEPNQDKGA